MAHKKLPIFDEMPKVTRKEARAAGLKRYFTGAPCSKGHVAPVYVLSNNCVVCSAAAALAWQKQMYCERADDFRRMCRDKKLKNPVAYMLTGSRSRAMKRGIEFSITASDISLPEKCPCCAVSMQMRSGPAEKGPLPNSPSIDRLDPSKGYVAGNVAVICWRCNEIKRNATLSELKTVVAWLESLQPKAAPLRLVS